MLQSRYFIGTIIPKARPRVTQNGVYMPPAYAEWKLLATHEFRKVFVPVIRYPVAVRVVLTGKHQRGGDSDNVVGSVLDALQDAGILKQDNMNHVIDQRGTLLYDKKKDPEFVVTIDDDPVLDLASLLYEYDDPFDEDDFYYEMRDILLADKSLSDALMGDDSVTKQRAFRALRNPRFRKSITKTLLREIAKDAASFPDK